MCAQRNNIADPIAALTDEIICEHIPSGSRVIDLGCGDGRLLSMLRDVHCCRGLGIELDRRGVIGSIGRGVSVIHADLDDGLPDIPDDSFDWAVLSQTLQQVRRPRFVLQEMLRAARHALVVVPNFGHWRVRLQVAWQGRAPVTRCLPYDWYETPNLHFMTMHDFRDLVERMGIRILKELPIIGGRAVNRAYAANLRANSALYVLERPETVGAGAVPARQQQMA